MRLRRPLVFLSVVCALLSACATPELRPSTRSTVRTSLQQINLRQGRYSGHVGNILKTDDGVEALIAETKSADPDISDRATQLLHMISRPPWESRIENPNWSEWWNSTGSKMTFEQLRRNFDSYHK